MKKKFITIIFALSMISLTACGAKIEQTADSLTVELGSKVNINIDDYFTSDKPEVLSEFMIDTTAVNTDAIGTYNITVGYEDERYNISVTVEDTTAPVIALKESGTYKEEDIVKIGDIVEVSDLSECTVAFLVDNEKVNEVIVSQKANKFKIIAEDIHGNRIEETVVFDIQNTAEAEDPFDEDAFEKEQAEQDAKQKEAEEIAKQLIEQWEQNQNKENTDQGQSSINNNTENTQNQSGSSNNNSQSDENFTDSSDFGFGSADLDDVKQGDSIGKGTIGG